jgi:hypothetical protein
MGDDGELCLACFGLGYVVISVYGSTNPLQPDGTLTVQRCDECEKFVENDESALCADEVAAHVASAHGIRCRLQYPCVLLQQPSPAQLVAASSPRCEPPPDRERRIDL